MKNLYLLCILFFNQEVLAVHPCKVLMRVLRPQSVPCAFSGKVGQISAMITEAKVAKPEGVALICSPHPQKKGDMYNKVLSRTALAFFECNYTTLRFDFRGVGRSEGSYGQIFGEIEDTKAAIAFLQEEFGPLPLWLAGFSFGAFTAAKASLSAKDLQGVLLIAPGVIRFDYVSLPQIPNCEVIQGECDEVVSSKDVQDWCEQNGYPYYEIEGATHEFHKKTIALSKTVREIILNHSCSRSSTFNV